jgi:iron(III) transport system substrate-binding protein
MIHTLGRIVGFGLVALMAANGPAAAQKANADWDALLAKAKTEKVVLTQHGNDAIPKLIDAFEKKYGIKVEQTAARPSRMLSRIRTEQKNNLYQWDIWMAATSNMTNIASPAGMLQPLDKLLVLPEVKDMSNWRSPTYVYGDKAHGVFTFQNSVTRSLFRNTDVAKGVEIKGFDDLLNPAFKGKIAMRDASRPNAALFVLALMQDRKGPEFATRFIKEMKPTTYEDPLQIFNSLVRGGSAITIGAREQELSRCLLDGGCKNIKSLPGFSYVLSWGVSVFKNAPHQAAATVFLNWLLSKEGQQVFVDSWAEFNKDGAVSMRKDVKPAKGHEDSLPDFTNPNEYLWVAHDKEGDKITSAVETYKKAKGMK